MAGRANSRDKDVFYLSLSVQDRMDSFGEAKGRSHSLLQDCISVCVDRDVNLIFIDRYSGNFSIT